MGNRDGKGAFFESHSGDFYSGMWKDDQKHGIGTFKFSRVPIHKGYGKLVYIKGDVYFGDFAYDRKNGHGKLIFYNGDLYDGEWKEDQFHGHGVYSYSNGSIYDGNWFAGKRHGAGLMTYKSGDVFYGQFVGDVMHGPGVYTRSSGEVREGLWRNGDPTTDEVTELDDVGGSLDEDS